MLYYTRLPYTVLHCIILYNSHVGSVAQTVRRSPPTAEVPSSRLGHSEYRSERNGTSVNFPRGVSVFPYQKFPSIIFLHSSHSFHFICSCDGASGVVERYPCYSKTKVMVCPLQAKEAHGGCKSPYIHSQRTRRGNPSIHPRYSFCRRLSGPEDRSGQERVKNKVLKLMF